MVREVIIEITVNFISGLMQDTGSDIIRKNRLNFKLQEIRKWVEAYIKDHDGSILTTGSFTDYIENYHPLEKIIVSISEGGDEKTKGSLIEEIVTRFDESYDAKCTVINRTELKDFFSDYYDKIDRIYNELLSIAEKYSIAKNERVVSQAREELLKSGNEILNGMADIKEMLSKNSTISDPVPVFRTIEAIVLSGDITKAKSLCPLIEGKSEDLEIAIPLLIDIISGKEAWLSDFKNAESAIADDHIYRSLASVAIYMAYLNDKKDWLGIIGNRCETTFKIAQNLISEDYEGFFVLEKSDKEKIPVLNVKLKNTFKEESWLTARICMKYLLGERYFVNGENLNAILVEPHSIIDAILIAEKIALQAYSKSSVTITELEDLYYEFEKLRQPANEIDKRIKTKLYALLLRLLILISDNKAKEFVLTMPEDIQTNSDIEMLTELINVKEGAVDFDRIMSICMKRGEYWLFADSIIQIFDEKPENAREAIEKYSFVVEEDPHCFLAYLLLLSACEDVDTAKEVIRKNEAKYNSLYEFWIEKIKITESEEDIETAINKSRNKELSFVTKTGLNDWIILLNDYGKYEAINDEIEVIERTDQITNNLVYYKGIALSRTNHELEALSLFKALFEHGNHSNAIVFQIMFLAIKNGRDVDEEVLFYAENSKESELLMAAAELRKRSGEMILAKRDAKKALLRAESNNSRAFGLFIGISMGNGSDEGIEREAVRCDVNTIITLIDQDNKELTFAIHEDDMLPEDNYSWQGVKHIYIETAINYGLFRKTVGEEVILSGNSYRIEEIEWLDVFLGRLCFRMLVKSGSAKAITLPTDKEGKPDAEALAETIKDIMGENNVINDWIVQYKDFSQMPVPFAIWPRASRAKSFQIIDAIYEDENIIFREVNSNNRGVESNYILSYSALCVLHKLGWKNGNDGTKVVVPEVLKNVISFETDEVKLENNKEHVASLGVNEGQVFYVEEDELSKRKVISDANDLKMYCDSFESVENTTDMSIPAHEELNLKKLLGIADYEALITAKNNNFILVSAEIPVTALAAIEELMVGAVCIADFLSATIKCDSELLDYIRKLVEHKFVLAITDSVVDRMISAYDTADEKTREQILHKWEEVLKMPVSTNEYKNILASAISENILQNDKRRNDFINPVMQILVRYVYRYFGLALRVSMGENGEIDIQTVRLKEEL